MITNYLGKQFVCNVDWLQFSVLTRSADDLELVCPEGFRLEVLPGNNIFRNRAILWRLDGLKMFTILWSPYSRLLKPNLMTCQVSNYVLYKSGIKMCFNLLQQVCECEFNSMGRLDICLDFEVSDYEMMFIRKLWTGEFYVQRKSEGAVWWHATDKVGGRFCHCLNWGSCSSEIKVKLYNKSHELGLDVSQGTSSEKPWISDEWKLAGIDVQKVWRLEFSMVGSGGLLWKQRTISLDDVTNPDWIWAVFSSLYWSRFRCRKAGRGLVGHKNMDDVVVLLCLPPVGVRLEWKSNGDDETATSEQIATLRRLVGTLDMPAVRANDSLFDSIAGSILTICNCKGLHGYFGRVYGMEVEDWLQAQATTTGGGIHDSIPDIKE